MKFLLDGTHDRAPSTATKQRPTYNVQAVLHGITHHDAGPSTHSAYRPMRKNIASTDYYGYLVWLRLLKQ